MAQQRRRKTRARSEQALDSITAWTDELPDTLILCRDLGHTWRPARAWLEDGGYGRVMRCARCRTERHQYLTMGGHVMSNRYDYADGYLAPKGTGSFTPDDRDHLRLESIMRLITKEG
jgi:hypothetical protein